MMCVYCWWSVYSLGLAMERWHIQRCRKRLKKWLGLGRSYMGHAPPLHGFQTFTILYIKLFYGHFFLTSLSSLNVKNLFHFCFPIFNNYFQFLICSFGFHKPFPILFLFLLCVMSFFYYASNTLYLSFLSHVFLIF